MKILYIFFAINWTSLLLYSIAGLVIGLIISNVMKSNANKKEIQVLSPKDFRDNMRKGQLIDVRNENDFKHKRINGARNFPKKSYSGNIHQIRKDMSVFIYDTDGKASMTVAKKLISKGYNPVYVLDGGLKNWSYTVKEQ